ncbi:hypothetical protein MMC18_006484 [Xylographa bjoerkii]|nr:hypothetical protein [Xylographa bjoerkii]
MASQRSAFNRSNTDVSVGIMDRKSVEHSTDNGSNGIYKSDYPSEKVDVEIVGTGAPAYDVEADNHFGDADVLTNAKDFVTHVLHVDDDQSLSPWTFRTYFLGLGMAIFASVLQEIYYFKPQTIYISVVFLTVIAYVLGEGLAFLIPRWGSVGRFLNPGAFNSKEHAAIVITASAAAAAASVATEILAAQKLYYNMDPPAAAAVFLVISSQLLGYGIAGLLRETLVHPTKMLWPINIPVNTLLETLHRDKKETKVRLKVFYAIFAFMFVWETMPEYIFPVLSGVSVFCLAKQNSLVFTNLFGGSQNNEGLGLLSNCFDWQYIAGLGSHLWVPLQTLTNSMIGYFGCIILFMAVYYNNVWSSQSFPLLSQLLFDNTSNATLYSPYNLSLILTSDNEINQAGLTENGIPFMTETDVSYLITTNMGITATFIHMLLWNYNDIKIGGKSKEQRKAEILADESMDPHYKLMVNYDEVPQWWFLGFLIISFVIGISTLYGVQSTLPWWGFIIAILLAAVMVLFFGAQYVITGFQFNQQLVIEMVAGYLHPGKPLGMLTHFFCPFLIHQPPLRAFPPLPIPLIQALKPPPANMYFTVIGFNSIQQAQLLLHDLKLAQLAHLSPKATFTAQIVGASFNSTMMDSIVTP